MMWYRKLADEVNRIQGHGRLGDAKQAVVPGRWHFLWRSIRCCAAKKSGGDAPLFYV